MKTNSTTNPGRLLQTVAASAMVMAAAWLTGCKSMGYQKSDAAAWNSQATAAKVRAESQELEVTIGALNDLVNQPAPDAKPQYLRFSAALDHLGSSARSTTNSVNRMWSKRTSYFQIWDKEVATIQDDDIRRSSQERRTEVSKLFDNASRQYDEAQNSLSPLLVYLRDIRKALSTDLTRDGLVAVQPAVNNASERARNVQTALTQSAAQLDTLSTQTSSVRVQDAK